MEEKRTYSYCPSREGNMVVTLPSLMLVASAFRAGGEESRMGGNCRRKRTKSKQIISRDVCLFGYKHYNFEHLEWL